MSGSDQETKLPSLVEVDMSGPSRVRQPPVPERGDLIDRYVVLSKLGAGAMGLVFAAYDPELDRKVALKLLKAWGDDQASARQRLQREAQALAKLNHPNVVAVHDVGVHSDQVFVAMEFVDGQTLGEWLGETRSWRETLRVFEAAGRGLAAAHAEGLVHRDFKPDNVMLGEDGRVRVMDFGLARADEGEARGRGIDLEALVTKEQSALETPLTRTGAVMGTPAYMALEQFAGLEVTPRSDQFAFCVALFEALHGRRPFEGKTLGELAFAVSEGAIVAHRNRNVPRWLDRIVVRGLSADPERRFVDMPALLAELVAGEARRRRTLGLATVGAASLVVAGVYGAGVLSERMSIAACETEGDAIEEIWNEETKRRVRAGIVATRVDHAEATARNVIPWLTGQAERWAKARTAACTKATVTHDWDADTLDRALWCLDERQMELAALVGELGEVRAETVHQAVPAASGLTMVEPCLDASLLGHLPPPPKSDRGTVEAIRRDLARASALHGMGHYEDALLTARESLERAEEIGWPSLVASADWQVGSSAKEAGRYPEAEKALERAYFVAAKAGATETAFRAAASLTGVVGKYQARKDDGLRWAEHAKLMLAGLQDDDGLWEVALLNELALVHHSTGSHDEALALQERAIELHTEALGPNHPALGTALNNLGSMHMAKEDFDRASLQFERAIELRTEALGSDHPLVAKSYVNLATLNQHTGNYKRALELHERAGQITEATLGPHHPEVAVSLNNRGTIEFAMGRYEGAAKLLERSLAINERTLSPDHPDLATTLANLGSCYHKLGKLDEAQARLERALAIGEKQLGPAHEEVVLYLSNLATVHKAKGEYRRATAYAERAVAAYEGNAGQNSRGLAAALTSLATIHMAEGRNERAAELLERSVQLREEVSGPNHARTAKALNILGDARFRLGQLDEAKALHQRAISIVDQALGAGHRQQLASWLTLAEIALLERRIDDAVDASKRALDICERDKVSDVTLAKARFIRARALREAGESPELAVDLAERARRVYREEGREDRLAEIEKWLKRGR